MLTSTHQLVISNTLTMSIEAAIITWFHVQPGYCNTCPIPVIVYVQYMHNSLGIIQYNALRDDDQAPLVIKAS